MSPFLLRLLGLSLLIAATLPAQPMLPARIGGTVTFNGQRVTTIGSDVWQFTAVRADGRPVTPAIGVTGLTAAGGYAFDVPLFDAATQPGGVPPGTAMVLSVVRNGVTLAISQPAGGAVTLGAAGSLAVADLVLTTTSGRLINLATRAQLAAGGTLIPGFVLAGTGQKSLLIRAVGPGLAPFGVGGTLAAPALQLYSSAGQAIAANTGWTTTANAAALSQAAARLGAFALPAGSADSVLLVTLGPGAYTAQVTGVGGTGGVVLVEVYDADAAPGGLRLVNLAARAPVGTGGNILIPGVVTAAGTRRLLVRAIGPALAAFGVGGVLADPQLQVLQGTTVIAANDNWSATAEAAEISATASRVGAFALTTGSRDAAVVVTVPAGPYTVQVSGVGGGTGEALVEIYEVP